jgi:hypothetical protein
MTDEPMRLRCACGWEASGTEDELIVAATEHGERVHNMRPHPRRGAGHGRD